MTYSFLSLSFPICKMKMVPLYRTFYVCRGQSLTSSVVPYVQSTLAFRTGSLIGLQLIKTGWPVSPRSSHLAS